MSKVRILFGCISTQKKKTRMANKENELSSLLVGNNKAEAGNFNLA
jgi:hypothetical protein